MVVGYSTYYSEQNALQYVLNTIVGTEYYSVLQYVQCNTVGRVYLLYWVHFTTVGLGECTTLGTVYHSR